MAILSFWSFLQICILVICVEPPDPHILDISNPNLESITLSDDTVDEVKTVTYISNDLKGKEIRTVSEDGIPIWTGDQEEEFYSGYTCTREGYMPIMVLLLNSDDASAPRHFLKHSDSWMEIKEEEFHERLNLMKEGLPDKPIPEEIQSRLCIDFSQTPDPAKIEMSDCKVNGVDERKYEAKGNIVISSVRDGTNAKREIWKAGRGEVGLVVTLIMRVKFPILLVIRFKRNKEDTFLKITYDGSEWKTIDDHTFYTILKRMREDAKNELQRATEAATIPLAGYHNDHSGDSITNGMDKMIEFGTKSVDDDVSYL